MESIRPVSEADDQAAGEEAEVLIHTRASSVGGELTTRAYVAIGSNLDDRQHLMRGAIADLGRRQGVRVAALSPVYETEAHTLPGQPPQPSFLNAVTALDTTLAPRDLLQTLLDVEIRMGRTRDGKRWQPRAIDLDLVLYGDRVVHEAGLSVPHPRLAERRFVLAPLADLAPELAVPGTGSTVAGLLDACPDVAFVARTDLEIS